MGFWLFMLIMNLLIPFSMIGFGRYFLKNAPKEINAIFGYRTTMSMKNNDTWEFAHKYCGKIWYICGSVVPTEKALKKTFDKNGKRRAMTKGLSTKGTASPHNQK